MNSHPEKWWISVTPIELTSFNSHAWLQQMHLRQVKCTRELKKIINSKWWHLKLSSEMQFFHLNTWFRNSILNSEEISTIALFWWWFQIWMLPIINSKNSLEEKLIILWWFNKTKPKRSCQILSSRPDDEIMVWG